MQQQEIARRFAFHPATTPEKANEHGSARHAVRTLAEHFAATLPEGREKALAFTALEEAGFWANAAIARPPQATQ